MSELTTQGSYLVELLSLTCSWNIFWLTQSHMTYEYGVNNTQIVDHFFYKSVSVYVFVSFIQPCVPHHSTLVVVVYVEAEAFKTASPFINKLLKSGSY